jgi:hypothetical protein
MISSVVTKSMTMRLWRNARPCSLNKRTSSDTQGTILTLQTRPRINSTLPPVLPRARNKALQVTCLSSATAAKPYRKITGLSILNKKPNRSKESTTPLRASNPCSTTMRMQATTLFLLTTMFRTSRNSPTCAAIHPEAEHASFQSQAYADNHIHLNRCHIQPLPLAIAQRHPEVSILRRPQSCHQRCPQRQLARKLATHISHKRVLQEAAQPLPLRHEAVHLQHTSLVLSLARQGLALYARQEVVHERAPDRRNGIPARTKSIATRS